MKRKLETMQPSRPAFGIEAQFKKLDSKFESIRLIEGTRFGKRCAQKGKEEKLECKSKVQRIFSVHTFKGIPSNVLSNGTHS